MAGAPCPGLSFPNHMEMTMSNATRRTVTPAGGSAPEELTTDLAETSTGDAVASTAPIVADLAPPVAPEINMQAPEKDSDEIAQGRVLIAFEEYQPNDLFSGPYEIARSLHDNGHIDVHPDAVAYALSLQGD